MTKVSSDGVLRSINSFGGAWSRSPALINDMPRILTQSNGLAIVQRT